MLLNQMRFTPQDGVGQSVKFNRKKTQRPERLRMSDATKTLPEVTTGNPSARFIETMSNRTSMDRIRLL